MMEVRKDENETVKMGLPCQSLPGAKHMKMYSWKHYWLAIKGRTPANRLHRHAFDLDLDPM